MPKLQITINLTSNASENLTRNWRFAVFVKWTIFWMESGMSFCIFLLYYSLWKCRCAELVVNMSGKQLYVRISNQGAEIFNMSMFWTKCFARVGWMAGKFLFSPSWTIQIYCRENDIRIFDNNLNHTSWVSQSLIDKLCLQLNSSDLNLRNFQLLVLPNLQKSLGK